MRRIALLIAGSGVPGCIVFEADPDSLTVVATDPEPGGRHPADAPLRVRFDRYLDPSMDWDRAITLRSSDLTFAADVGYDPAGPDLVVRPRLALRPGLGHRLRLDSTKVRGLDGATLEVDFEITFVTGPAAGGPPLPPVDFEADLEPLFERRCGCHGPEPAVYPPLTAAALRALPPRRDPDRPFVEPGAPLRSLLVLKLLPGYPGLLGETMPPDAPLAPEEIRLVVDWVAGL